MYKILTYVSLSGGDGDTTNCNIEKKKEIRQIDDLLHRHITKLKCSLPSIALMHTYKYA